MSGFAGFYLKEALHCGFEYNYSLLEQMIRTQKHRKELCEKENLLLTHLLGLGSTDEMATMKRHGKTYHLLFGGELYNRNDLRALVSGEAIQTELQDDATLLLHCFLDFGETLFEKLRGSFSFALAIEEEHCLYLVRDGLGTKPLFYAETNHSILFGTEIKAILAHPDIEATLSLPGIRQLFLLGPARIPGSTLFDGIHEVNPGSFVRIKNNRIHKHTYWELKTARHTDSYQDTVTKTGELIKNAIANQAQTPANIACLLSGGVDSSIVTAVYAGLMAEKGAAVSTYSFEYEDNDTYFSSNSFQPSLDRPFVERMVSFLGTRHTDLRCSQEDLAANLTASLVAHDMPAMGDIDASLLIFCRKISPFHKAVFTGECADEVFGGYPWFHKKELLSVNTFPWSWDTEFRTGLLQEELTGRLSPVQFIDEVYANAADAVSFLPEENELDRIRRTNNHLSLGWFGATLLDRMERCSAATGLFAKLPFADRDLVEYIYNVPWDMRIQKDVIKYLLRDAFRDLLPEEVLFRKKSPYPKTYHPRYEELLKNELLSRINDPASPLLTFVDKNKLSAYIVSPKDYSKPWYGQLMAGPQMLSYFIQIDQWIKTYHIHVKI